jgi:FtsP/CotA-like multicopper oxidase with cupredoxin domain
MLAVALLALAAPAAPAGDWDSLGRVSQKKTVTVRMRNGQRPKGTIQQVGPESLTLAPEKPAVPAVMQGAAQSGNAIQVKRGDVARVTRKTRLLPALIGAAALGGAFGIANAGSKEGTPAVRAFGTCAMAAVGALVGAAIGHTSTIYEADPRK